MSLNTKQNEQLLRGINPKRVLHLRGQSHLAGWDVKAHLTRIFGFEGWDKKIRSVELVFETQGLPDGSKKGWYVTYRCLLTLVIRDPGGNVVREIDGAATGSAENQPQRGEAHDLALKNSVTYALKVCATDLGDQFGLSLYNNGGTSPIVMQTLAGHDDVEQAVPGEINPDSDPDSDAQPEPAAESAPPAVNGNGHKNGRASSAPRDSIAQGYANAAAKCVSADGIKQIREEAEIGKSLGELVADPENGVKGLLGAYLDYLERSLNVSAKAEANLALAEGAHDVADDAQGILA